MAKAAFKWLIVANAIIGFAESGWAQDTGPGKAEPKSTTSFGSRWTGDIDVGEREYSSSCAACHGADGKGNGPVTAELKVPPPDLTVLARKRWGVSIQLCLRDNRWAENSQSSRHARHANLG